MSDQKSRTSLEQDTASQRSSEDAEQVDKSAAQSPLRASAAEHGDAVNDRMGTPDASDTDGSERHAWVEDDRVSKVDEDELKGLFGDEVEEGDEDGNASEPGNTEKMRGSRNTDAISPRRLRDSDAEQHSPVSTPAEEPSSPLAQKRRRIQPEGRDHSASLASSRITIPPQSYPSSKRDLLLLRLSSDIRFLALPFEYESEKARITEDLEEKARWEKAMEEGQLREGETIPLSFIDTHPSRSTIRWKETVDPANANGRKVQSNCYLVRYADGRRALFVGKQAFACHADETHTDLLFHRPNKEGVYLLHGKASGRVLVQPRFLLSGTGGPSAGGGGTDAMKRSGNLRPARSIRVTTKDEAQEAQKQAREIQGEQRTFRKLQSRVSRPSEKPMDLDWLEDGF